ncbi:hypothetical protein [Rhodococcus ruber]|uniref:hypothetical protein n=1 Tax=Rhodococcus ruber TaxID=1830 RepID=UPI0011218AB0|nr:hypothetical protein [Rhodococcus ruber]MDO2380094.1 hypothetical protein [Rhodococcus ruber]QDC17326.1 hypothetical protein E2561_24295 [Rhodococcus ruber]
MFMEFQVNAGVFATILRNRLRSLPICLDLEFPVFNSNYVLDRIDFEDGTSLQRERRLDRSSGTAVEVDAATNRVGIITPTGNLYDFSAAFLQVRQPVIVHLVTQPDLQVHAELPTPSLPVALDLVFNVDLWAPNQTQGGGRPLLRYRIGYINYGAYDAVIPVASKDAIAQVVNGFAPAPVEMDLTALGSALGGTAGGTVNAVNCGIVCDRAASRVAMRIDFQVNGVRSGRVTPTFFEQDPADLLRGREWAVALDKDQIVDQVREQIRLPLSESTDLKIVNGPVATWKPERCAVQVFTAVELFDACPFFVDDIDMDVDVNITASLGVSDNQLTTHVNIIGDPSDLGEQILCSVTGALLWPFIGPLLLKDEELDKGIGYYFAGLAAGPVGDFIGIMAAIQGASPPDISDDLGAKTRKIDDHNYETVRPLNVRMVLSPPIQQRLNFDAVYGTTDLLVFTGSLGGLSATQSGTTSVEPSELGWFLDGSCRAGGYGIAAIATITVNGSMDMPLCSGRIIDDPLGEYRLTREGNNLTIRESFGSEFVALAEPYPCQVRVITKRGVRTIVYPPVGPITDAERQSLEEMRRSFNKMCKAWQDSIHEREIIGVPKPQPMEDPDWTLWQIAVHDLAAGDEVTISTLEGPPLAVLTAPQTGVLFTTLMLSAEADDQLQIALAPARDSSNRRPSVAARQLHYAARAKFGIRGNLRGLQFERDGNRQLLRVQDDLRVIDIDTTVASHPFMVSSKGFLDTADISERPARRIGDGRRLVTLPSDIREDSLRTLMSAPSVQNVNLVDFVSEPRIGGIRKALYVRTADSTTIYDISDSAKPSAVQRLSDKAWFENCILGGHQLARFDSDSNTVHLYHCVGVAEDRRMTWYTSQQTDA